MKIRPLAAAVAAAAGVTVLVSPAAGAAASADTCPRDYVWQVDVDRLHVWESENYKKQETSLSEGTYVRGPSGRRANGWVPVRYYWNGGDWVLLLEGANDTNDFIRSSGLRFFGCAG